MNSKTNNDYADIAENLNRNPQRVPKHNGSYTETFIKFLQLVYRPEEASLVKHLNPAPEFKSVQEIADITGKDKAIIAKTLESLRKKNSLMGMGEIYILPPMPILLNIHQFHDEKFGNDIEAANLYLDFFIEKGYNRYYETSEKGTPVFRTIPIEQSIQCGEKILEWEEVKRFLNSLDHGDLAMVPCPCRSRTEKLGIRECADKFPVGYCIMLGMSAKHFLSIGMGKKVTKKDAMNYIKEMLDLGLICNTDNAMTKNSIICLCCNCCCSQVRGRTRWDNPDSVDPSNFVPEANEDCIACGKCARQCPMDAITINRDTKRPDVNINKCLGCGVCTFACPSDALKLKRQERSTPFTSGGKLMKTINAEND